MYGSLPIKFATILGPEILPQAEINWDIPTPSYRGPGLQSVYIPEHLEGQIDPYAHLFSDDSSAEPSNLLDGILGGGISGVGLSYLLEKKLKNKKHTGLITALLGVGGAIAGGTISKII